MRHKHHIIPRHAGGIDGPIAILTPAEHAEAHWILWYTHKRIHDKNAALGLEGMLDKANMFQQVMKDWHDNNKEIVLERNRKVSKARCIPILCITNGKVYESAHHAARDLNLHQGNVREACTARRTHTGGFQFKYL
jgi:hypothetical protein